MELLKLLSTSELVAQLISFLILFFVLKKFFWGKMLTALENRRERIANKLQTIEKHQEEVIHLKAELYEKLNQIEDVSQMKINEALAKGRELTDQIRKKANQEAQDIITNAEKLVDQKITKVESELRDKIVDVSLRAAEQLIQEKFTEEQDRKLINDFLDKLEKV